VTRIGRENEFGRFVEGCGKNHQVGMIITHSDLFLDGSLDALFDGFLIFCKCSQEGSPQLEFCLSVFSFHDVSRTQPLIGS